MFFVERGIMTTWYSGGLLPSVCKHCNAEANRYQLESLQNAESNHEIAYSP